MHAALLGPGELARSPRMHHCDGHALMLLRGAVQIHQKHRYNIHVRRFAWRALVLLDHICIPERLLQASCET